MSNRSRYTHDDVTKNSFYKLPKFLFDEEFSGLSNDARVLYSLIRDRHDLSIRNGWFDENGHVYLHFKREEMQSTLKISKPTAIKAVNDLKAHGLLEEVRQGQGNPNRIYLLKSSTQPPLPQEVKKVDFKNEINFTSKVENSEPLEVKNLDFLLYSNTDFNNTEKREGEGAPAPSEKTHGEYGRVRLSESEYIRLVDKHTEPVALDYIAQLDCAIAAGRYKRNGNHCATIESWIQRDAKPPPAGAAAVPKQQPRSRFANFKQREYDHAEIERMERKHLVAALGDVG